MPPMTREREFRKALIMEAKALETGKAPGTYPRGSFRSIAQALLFRAADGDIAAIREFADRVDGRVPNAIVGSDEHPPAEIVVRWRETPEPTEPSGT
jgi:hypothetical protein